MPLFPLNSIDTLPTTSRDAIREFDDRYLAAFAAAEPQGWADDLGEVVATSAPMINFPVTQLRTKYVRTEGESKFKKMAEKSFDVKVEEFDDGYQAKLKDLFEQVFAYRLWKEAPARFITAEGVHRHLSIAALLEAGTSTPCVDGQNFFSATHPVNIIDATVKTQIGGSASWSNNQATAKSVVSIANIQAEVTAMMKVPDENGLILGVMPDTLLVPIDQYEATKNLLAQQMVLADATTATSNGAVNNPYLGRFNVIPCKELTNTLDWYMLDSKMIAQGLKPWVSLRQTVPASLALRSFDESSDFFKNTGDIKMSSHVWYGFALAFPHAIRRVTGL